MLWLCRMTALLLVVSISINTIRSSDIYTKYSGPEKFMTVDQFQSLLDSVHGSTNQSEVAYDMDYTSCGASKPNECIVHNRSCLTAADILDQMSVNDGMLDAKSFQLACPIVLGQIDSRVCRENHSNQAKPEKEKPKAIHVWGFGLLFVTIISLCSLVGVSVMPLMEKAFYKQLLTLLIGLAVGSLSGSSVFHLIPQAFGLLNNTEQHHHYLNISLMVWSGIWVFFMTERILKIISDHREARKQQEPCKDLCSELASPTGLLPLTCTEEDALQGTDIGQPRPTAIYDCQEQAIKASFGHQEKARVSHNSERMHYEPGKDNAISTIAWMVVFGDGLHNFIDGLSIGAAFNESVLTGVSISLAVLCEELPHELGDFAVLLNAGMTMRQAVVYNFLSACTCYLGLILGIVLGEIEASTHIFAFAGGMFLYISLVDMVPEMNEVAEEAGKRGVMPALKVLLLQNIGMGIGMFALYILARYQDTFSFG